MVPGTEASALIVPGPAAQLAAAHNQRKQAEQEIAALLEPLPLFHLLTSLPDMGVRTTAAVIVAIGCKTDPSSRIYYDRRRTRGKTHTQAVLRHGNPAMPAVGLPAPHPIRREHPASRDAPENQSKSLRTTPTGVDEARHGSWNHEGVVSRRYGPSGTHLLEPVSDIRRKRRPRRFY